MIAHAYTPPLSVLGGYQEMLIGISAKLKEISIKQAIDMVSESRKQIKRYGSICRDDAKK